MISDPSVTDPSCSLEQLTEKFNRWRATRTGRGITPPELRSRAVALLNHYARATITRQHGVNPLPLANGSGWSVARMRWYEVENARSV